MQDLRSINLWRRPSEGFFTIKENRQAIIIQRGKYTPAVYKFQIETSRVRYDVPAIVPALSQILKSWYLVRN